MARDERYRRYRERHPERVRATQKASRLRRLDAVQAYNRAYQAARRKRDPAKVKKEKDSWYAREGKAWNAKRRAAWRNDPEVRRKNRVWRIAHKYGLSAEAYQQLHDAQGGLCAVCREAEQTRGKYGDVVLLSVDHDHKTKKLRGLLCNNCNRGIGLLKENISVLQHMIEYLKIHGGSSERMAL